MHVPQLVVHYSGHGSQVATKSDKSERDGKDEVLVPCDMNFISDNDLKLLFAPLANRPNVKLTFLADCCHSGTLLDMKKVCCGVYAIAKRHRCSI